MLALDDGGGGGGGSDEGLLMLNAAAVPIIQYAATTAVGRRRLGCNEFSNIMIEDVHAINTNTKQFQYG